MPKGGAPYDTSKDPLGEFAGTEFKALNVEGGSFDGLAEADAEAEKALGVYGQLSGTTKNSSIAAHGTVSIPNEGGPDSNRKG